MSAKSSKVSTASRLPSTFKITEDPTDTYITLPPDGGWGWMVVVASFLCNFVADGSIYTFGLFLKDISETFNVPPTTVALGNSLMTGVYFVSGPITCALVNRWGFQLTGFIGGLIAAAAFFCSSFVSSIEAFLFIYGIIGGFGFGLVYVPSIIVIGFYFETWRALATSIAVTGSAVGIMAYPFIIEGALKKYSWKVKFKVIAACCLVTSCLALIYRPLKPARVLTKDRKSGDGESAVSFNLDQKSGLSNKTLRRYHNLAYPTASQLHKESTVVLSYKTDSSSSLFVMTTEESSTSVLKSKVSAATQDVSERCDRLSTVYEIDNTKHKWKNCLKKLCCGYQLCSWRLNKPMYRDDIFYTSSVYTLPEYAQSRSSRLSKNVNAEYTLSVTRMEQSKTRNVEHRKCCPDSIMRTLVTMLDCSLFKSPSFSLLALSGFLTVLGMYVPFIYLKARSNEMKLNENVTYYFLPVLGAANAAGRIISGVISTFPHARPLLVSYTSIIICGVITIVSYFLTTITGQFIYIVIFGLTIAALASLRALVVVEMLGLEKLTNAYGLLLLAEGIAAFAGMPLAGLIVTSTNSYNGCFIYSGCNITLSGILLIPIKRISNWEKSKK